MKKTLKLLTLAMLFAMPLAACGNDPEKPKEEEKQETDSSTMTDAKLEAEGVRIAKAYFEEDDIEIGDYEEENSEDYSGEYSFLTKYTDSSITFFDMWDEAEDSPSGVESMLKGYLASGAKKNSSYGFSDDVYGSYSIYYTANGFGYNIYIEDYSDEEGDYCFWALDIFDASKISVYDSLMYEEGGDEDWDEDWDEDDEDDDGGEVSPIQGSVTIDFSKGISSSGTVNGIRYVSDGLTTDENGDGHAFNQLRLYANNYLTITAGSNITSIEFTLKDKKGPLDCDVGSIAGTTWTGSAKSVTFTASAQARIVSIVIK